MLRMLKILLVASMALMMTLAAIGNLTLPGNGFEAVKATVSMVGTKSQPEFMWRAITDESVIWFLWGLIVLGEALSALVCWLGSFRMLRARKDVLTFNHSKELALAGLGLMAFVYAFGWLTIANEWYLMYQLPPEMNALPDAFRIAAIALLILLFVNADDR